MKNIKKLSKRNPFVIRKPYFFFTCEYGVYPKKSDASICYCTEKIRAEMVATALTDWWASRKGQKWLKNNVLYNQYLRRKQC